MSIVYYCMCHRPASDDNSSSSRSHNTSQKIFDFHSLIVELGDLEQLQSLILSFNEIAELPPTLCDLTYLEILWLAGNQLKSLPKGLSKLKRLDWHYMMTSSAVNDNPLEHPPMSVVWQGPAAIDKYLSLHESNSTQNTANSHSLKSRRR